MNPHLTDVFNPLANAIQEFRQNNEVKGTALVDSMVETLFPDNGEIWNPAAGNMFRRAVYLLFDYYIEQEKYIRYLGHKNNTPTEVIDDHIDKLYRKVTLYNVYALIGELAAKKSKDVEFINVDKDAPAVNEKDFLTLLFDAMSLLPSNPLRGLAIKANNAIKQIASAETTVAGIYATLLTGLSVYADPTAAALMSGSPRESMDVTGLGFPRRLGVQFDKSYVDKFKITGELVEWSIYRDRNFTNQYGVDDGKKLSDFTHKGKLDPSNWAWGYFKGIFDQETVYVKMDIRADGRTLIKSFYFEFKKGYKKFDSITYVINPVTKRKIIDGGTLIELDPDTKEPAVSEFSSRQMDVEAEVYRNMNRPIFMSNLAFYTETPKFLFAITPPHLQVYQKHILVIIKQIIDAQFDKAYTTKANRKPIVGTRFLLDEFGNIRSGENGIPNIDTVASIALGQNIQLTFVLQSFQQLRAVYKEDVEKILRSNSANTVFLKSDDEELINDLVRRSGQKHEFRVKSKSVARKVRDVMEVGEPTVNYSGENGETTALTSNDLLFLAGKTPGNAAVFSQGEMPIVNKLSTFLPMAAGLHTHLPQPVGGQYSDSTMPSLNIGGGIKYQENTIDGDELVTSRVKQAQIWKYELKPKFLEIAKNEGLTLDERDGSLSDLVMNSVYEEYDKEAGQSHVELEQPVALWEIAEDLSKQIKIVSNTKLDKNERMSALSSIKEILVRCLMEPELKELTDIYKDTPEPTKRPSLRYDTKAVSQFAKKFAQEYPKPVMPEYEDIGESGLYEEARRAGYKYSNPEDAKRSISENKPFDGLNSNQVEALEQIIEDIVLRRIDVPNQVRYSGDSIFINDQLLAHVDLVNDNSVQVDFADIKGLEKLVPQSANLLSLVNEYVNNL